VKLIFELAKNQHRIMETRKNVKDILTNLEILDLNQMQLAAQAAIVNEEDILLLSPTGSGKTLAFLLPIFAMLDKLNPNVQCLILTPSRELALQIESVWKKMSTGFKVNVSYGGHLMATEIQNLSAPPALLIGTPGRIADHIIRKTFDLSSIKTLVLDEFDKSLDLGFHDQMSFIINNLKNLQKRVLVSATAGIKIPDFVGIKSAKILNYIDKNVSGDLLSTKLVISESKDKVDKLFELICNLNSESALIFCNHRDAVERTSEMLNSKGIVTTFYHGGLEQDDRERALILFRNGSVNYLITTDLAARGLDIPEMKHVIHFHLPLQEHEFIHRNGRTARMHATGTSYILVHKDENLPNYLDEKLEEMVFLNKNKLPKLPEFVTIYVSGGKKNKLNKIDIVGFFSQKGGLEKGDLGLIEVKDFISFAAVKRTKANSFLDNIKDEKMKGKKYKIEIAR
jgi:superfamily II DNA/RNA helicase